MKATPATRNRLELDSTLSPDTTSRIHSYVCKTRPRPVALRQRVTHKFFISTHDQRWQHVCSNTGCEYSATCTARKYRHDTPPSSRVPRLIELNPARNHWPRVSSSHCPHIAQQHALPFPRTAPLSPLKKERSPRNPRHLHSPDLGTRWSVSR